MSETKIMYQRAEYSFGNPIETVEVVRQTDKCYWVMEQGFRAKRESRRLKASNPPLRETWEEAKQDLIDFRARKAESAERAYKRKLKELKEARELQNPEGS